jgi:hypothetical protein
VPARTLLGPPNVGVHNTGVIQAVLRRRVELRVLAEGVTFTVGPTFDSPFRVPKATLVEAAPNIVHSGAALSIHIRHALEIALWHRVLPPPRAAAAELATSALACWTASQYIDTLRSEEAMAAVDALPEWFQQVRRFVQEHNEERDRETIATELVTLGSRLLPLQGMTRRAVGVDPETFNHAVVLTAELLDAALPTEQLLTCGGDSRLSVHVSSRVNKYGCSAVPQSSTLSMSSCTASSPSESSYRAAEDARQRLLGSVLAGSTMRDAFAMAMEDTRHDLMSVVGLDRVPSAELVLAASGTDCELYALQVAMHGHDRDLLTIVIGPDEIGGGSLLAASGRHFDCRTPSSLGVTAGEPVDGIDVDRVRVESLPLRDRTGNPIPIADIDAAVESIAREAASRHTHVLLHVVDSSKTGLRAPSTEAVRRLHRDLGDVLTVVVDAAQMRTRAETLVEYVCAGWLVMISGSKFFGGPPFSGALLVPGKLACSVASAPPAPSGIGAYLSAFEVPPAWNAWRRSLSSVPNLGLLLRWRAALAEMHAFHALDGELRDERLRELCSRIESELRTRSCLEIVPAPLDDRHDGRRWDANRSIWTFVLKRSDATNVQRRIMDYEEAWQVYVWLNRDVSPLLPSHASAAERRLAATRCHIGQPVRITWNGGEPAGGLRLALGARSMRASANSPACVLDKIEMILRYWSHLTAQRAVA